ncbi:MAG: hypothetical protein AB7V56_12605 [Candidatus Nitrosocosmicus sp.]
MPQFSERKKLILTFLVINSGIHHLTEEEAMKYIKLNFGKDISRRTYYNYKKALYENTTHEEPIHYDKSSYSGLSMVYDSIKSNKGLISMALMIERSKIIKKGIEKGIKLQRYDKCDFHPKYYQRQFTQTKDLLNDSFKLIKRIQLQKQ